MKRFLPYIFTGIAAYLLWLVATLPAATVWGLASSHLPKNVALKDLQGTLWRGSAGEAYLLGQRVSSLNWELSVLPLLWGTVQAELRLRQDEGYFNGTLSRSLGGDLSLGEVEARMNMSSLGFLTRSLPRGFEATLALDLEQLDIEDHLISDASGVLVLQDARLSSGKGMELGDLRLELLTDDKQVKGTLTDGGSGGVQVDGLLTLGTEDGAWNFSAYLSARDNADPMIKQGLGMLGRPGADGRVNATRQGRLSDLGGIFTRPREAPPAAK